MTMKFYKVTVGADGASRALRVPSPTDVQAADAAATLMQSGEAILSIEEVSDDGSGVDAAPPLSQAAELADVTPGAASVD